MKWRDLLRKLVSAAPAAVAGATVGWAVAYNVQITPRDFALAERDRELSGLRVHAEAQDMELRARLDEINRLKLLAGQSQGSASLLATYGPDVWFYRSVVVTKSEGGDFETCIGSDCFKVRITPVQMYTFTNRPGPEPVVEAMVEFPRPLLGEGAKGIGVGPMPLQPGWWGGVDSPDYDYKVVVESVGYERARLGLAIRSGSIKLAPGELPRLTVNLGSPEPGP